jgi:hypothetical protein
MGSEIGPKAAGVWQEGSFPDHRVFLTAGLVGAEALRLAEKKFGIRLASDDFDMGACTGNGAMLCSFAVSSTCGDLPVDARIILIDLNYEQTEIIGRYAGRVPGHVLEADRK